MITYIFVMRGGCAGIVSPSRVKDLFYDVLIFLITLFSLYPPAVMAQNRSSEPVMEVSAGTGLFVMGGDLTGFPESAKISKAILLKELQVHLKKEGVWLLDEREWLQLPGSAVAYLEVGTSGKDGPAAGLVRLSLQKPVDGEGPAEGTVYTTLWSAEETIDRYSGEQLIDAVHRLASRLASASVAALSTQ